MQVINAVSNLIFLAEARNRRADRQARDRIERLPAIKLTTTANHYKSFTAPNPDYKATIHRADGKQIGTAAYALSPLDDRVYLFRIEIEAVHRRRGYGLALLWYLAKTYERPITPVHQAIGSYEFWFAARRMEAAGLVVTTDVRISEMDDEASRWQHLRPQAERLQQQISERLSRHEPWDVAVGRGLDA
jgi:hypothetical protein